MTRITCECPHCGRVELGINDVVLVVSPGESDAWFLFDCVGCVRRVVKPAPQPVVTALSRVYVARWTVPAEVAERRVQLRVPPPIGTDDLLDLMLALRSCDEPGDLVAELTPADGPVARPSHRPLNDHRPAATDGIGVAGLE